MTLSRLTVAALICAAAVAVMLHPGEAGAQCAACREALKTGGTEGLLRGFAWSVALLTATPVALVSGLAIAIFRSARRHRAALARAGAPLGDS